MNNVFSLSLSSTAFVLLPADVLCLIEWWFGIGALNFFFLKMSFYNLSILLFQTYIQNKFFSVAIETNWKEWCHENLFSSIELIKQTNFFMSISKTPVWWEIVIVGDFLVLGRSIGRERRFINEINFYLRSSNCLGFCQPKNVWNTKSSNHWRSSTW